MQANRFKEYLISPFYSGSRINKALVIIFILINSVVLFNAIYHFPYAGYDASAHIKYIEILSEFRLPARDETRLFYSPPLPYFLPSLLNSSGAFNVGTVAKFAQLLNVIYSIILTFYLIKICGIIRPNNSAFKIASLGFMGMLPVYYKTFAFIRGEPLLVFLSVFAAYKTLEIFVKGNFSLKNIIVLGFSLGLVLLSRQMGFFLFPAIFIFAVILMLRQKRFLILVAVILSFIIAFIIGGWYYIYLYNKCGSVKTYVFKPCPEFSFSNQPLNFYFGLSLNKLFRDPVRRAFHNQFLPIFYSETWGDYWCYFIIYGRDSSRKKVFISGKELERILRKETLPLRFKTNRYEAGKYLGRVNLISLFPSLFLLAGVILGTIYFGRFTINKTCSEEIIMCSFLYLVVIISFAGYFWYLIMYPIPGKGDTVKATYIIQIFPFIAILAAEFLQKIKQKSTHIYWLIVVLLAISVVHNLPAFITRYIRI